MYLGHQLGLQVFLGLLRLQLPELVHDFHAFQLKLHFVVAVLKLTGTSTRTPFYLLQVSNLCFVLRLSCL